MKIKKMKNSKTTNKKWELKMKEKEPLQCWIVNIMLELAQVLQPLSKSLFPLESRFGDEERRLMHLVPAPAVRLKKRRVLSNGKLCNAETIRFQLVLR